MLDVSSMSSFLDTLEANAGKALKAAIIFAVGLFIAVLVRNIMRRSLSPRLPPHVYKPLETVVYYSLLILAGMGALSPFGISLTSLIIAGGFAGIVIGLATQSTLSNLVSGIMLLVEQPLRIGDPVSVSGYSGVVAGINVFSTQIRTWDGPIVRIPNNEVFNTIITNYSRMKARRVEFKIGIHYDSDLQKAIHAIRKLMEDHPLCLVNPGPEVFVEDYGDNAILLKMRCWAPTQAWFATKVDLQTKLKTALDEAGIKIPYPQLDVHFVEKLRVALDEDRDKSK